MSIQTLRVCPGPLDLRCQAKSPKQKIKTHGGGEDTAEQPEGALWPWSGLGALSGPIHQKGTESSEESAEHPGGRQAARRVSIWQERPYREDSVEWVEEEARRDPSERKIAEQLEGVAWPEVCQVVARRGLSIQKGVK